METAGADSDKCGDTVKSVLNMELKGYSSGIEDNIILHGNYMDARFIPHSSITQGAALSVLPDTINDGWVCEGRIEKLEYSELKSTIYTVDLELVMGATK